MLMASACSSDNVIDQTEEQDEWVDVVFTTPDRAHSRFTDAGFANGDKVNIYMLQSDGRLGDKKEFRYSNGGLVPVTDTFKKKKNQPASFIAFTPGYTESAGSLVFQGGIDYLVGGVYDEVSPNIEFLFGHIHSKIKIRVVNSTYSVSRVELLYAYNQEIWEYDTEDKDYHYTTHGPETTVTMVKDNSDGSYYYLLPAMNYLPNMRVRVTDIRNHDWTMDFPKSEGFVDSHYIYTFEADLAMVQVKSSRGGETSDGEVERVSVEPVE